MTLFRHWKTGSIGQWFPQIKMSPMTVPAYSLESFPAMAWGGRWWGDSNRVHQSHVQETNQSSRKPNGQAWGRALKKRDPTPSKSCGQGTASLPPSAELHAYEHQHPGAKQPQSWHRAGDHSLCSYQPEVRDRLSHRASCPHKSLGVELNKGCSGSLLTKLETKA